MILFINYTNHLTNEYVLITKNKKLLCAVNTLPVGCLPSNFGFIIKYTKPVFHSSVDRFCPF